jgi:hypothetical protein
MLLLMPIMPTSRPEKREGLMTWREDARRRLGVRDEVALLCYEEIDG